LFVRLLCKEHVEHGTSAVGANRRVEHDGVDRRRRFPQCVDRGFAVRRRHHCISLLLEYADEHAEELGLVFGDEYARRSGHHARSITCGRASGPFKEKFGGVSHQSICQ